MEAEIYKVCAKMLEMDERNFHCWNYRLQVVTAYLNEMKTRSVEWSVEGLFVSHQRPLLERECEMALGLIKKNFSNFSAWHYRSKLMPLLKS